MFGFGFPVAFLSCQFGGRSFFLELTQPNVNIEYNNRDEKERGKHGSNLFHIQHGRSLVLC